MYAVVKTGGKQYRVAKDDVLTVEKLDAEAGAVIELAEVLAIDDGKGLTIGTPMIDGRALQRRCWNRRRPTRSSSSRKSAGRIIVVHGAIASP